MKAIETKYKGYRFRSRLEARWAVFFDAMGIKWEYEPEGFDLGFGALYLPDFRLTNTAGQVQWVEVKPEGVTHDRKFKVFSKHASSAYEHGKTCETTELLVSGDPYSFLHGAKGCVCPRCGFLLSKSEYDLSGRLLNNTVVLAEALVYCWVCDMDTPQGGGHPEEQGRYAPVTPHKGAIVVTGDNWVVFKNQLERAATKARSARFEHGERGAA